MEYKYCLYCLDHLSHAALQGFSQNFQLLQNGLLFLPSIKKLYEVEDINVIVTSCRWCATSRYLITTNDGIKGVAIEFWEAWSEK